MRCIFSSLLICLKPGHRSYVILRHPNQTLLMMQRFRGLAVAYGALFASGLPALSQGRMSSDTYGNGS